MGDDVHGAAFTSNPSSILAAAPGFTASPVAGVERPVTGASRRAAGADIAIKICVAELARLVSPETVPHSNSTARTAAHRGGGGGPGSGPVSPELAAACGVAADLLGDRDADAAITLTERSVTLYAELTGGSRGFGPRLLRARHRAGRGDRSQLLQPQGGQRQQWLGELFLAERVVGVVDGDDDIAVEN